MKKELNKIIKRNEDAIDNLEIDNSMSFWKKQRLILFHERRILRCKLRSLE